MSDESGKAVPSDDSLLAKVDWPGLQGPIKAQQRNRETFTPTISMFRWWARRSHALIGAVLDAAREQTDAAQSVVVGDPFSGGGTVAVEAIRRDMGVHAQDLHPWASAGLRNTVQPVDPDALEEAATKLLDDLSATRSQAYGTTCPTHGEAAELLTAFWVRKASCPSCSRAAYLYPYPMITRASRRKDEDHSWWGCRRCGEVTRSSDSTVDRRCRGCGRRHEARDHSLLQDRAVDCPHRGCGARYPAFAGSAPEWRMVLVQRSCESDQYASHFDRPTEAEKTAPADFGRDGTPPELLKEIPDGLETRLLARAGLRSWADLYPDRQLHVLCQIHAAVTRLETTDDIRARLRLAACGCGEMAGHISRWDRLYPKAFEATANHRYALTGLSCETNPLADRGRGSLPRRLKHTVAAARWTQEHLGSDLAVQRLRGSARRRRARPGQVYIAEGSSARQVASDGSVDLVLTDPPYFDDVQYGELAGLFLAWARVSGLVSSSVELDLTSEAVANSSRGVGPDEYLRLLGAILRETRRTVTPNGRVILTFHNSDMRAWWALGQALKQAGLKVVALAVTHAENERDHAKRGAGAFSSDLVIECRRGRSPQGQPVIAWPGNGEDEATELLAAGRSLAAAQRGESSVDYAERFRELRGSLETVRIGEREESDA